ncbi:MAG: EcsC family protein [Eggerthellaceae bacterium]|nr:EcsC family protein [Eggerthellaceae bacterium]
MVEKKAANKEPKNTKQPKKQIPKIDEETAGIILDAAYNQAVKGIPKVSRSVDKLANDYLSKHATPDEAAKALAKMQVSKCGTSGFLTGLGGLITLPATIPANIGSVMYVQLRMVAAIAKIGGYDIYSDQVQTLVYMCLTGTAITDVIKDAGIQVGAKSLTAAIKKIPGTALVKINQKVGFRFITKFGEKGVINLGKMVPVLGGIIGGSVDVATTIVIANNAIKMFINDVTPFGEMPTEDEVLDIQAIDASSDKSRLI